MLSKIIIQEILEREKNIEDQIKKCLSDEEFKKIHPYLYAIREIKHGIKARPYLFGIIKLKEYFKDDSKEIPSNLIEPIKLQLNNIEKIMLEQWPELEIYKNKKNDITRL
jgi:hypothetical protein